MANSIYKNEKDISNTMEMSYRKYLVKVCMVVALPALIIFTIRDFYIGRYLVGWTLLSMILILIGLFFLVGSAQFKSKENLIYQYFLTVLFLLYGFYLIYSIGIEGDLSKIPWAYVFPVVVFFALGAGWALIWVAILLSALLSLDIYLPSNEHLVIQDLKLRFYISFMMVIIASFFFERLKKRYQLELIDNQRTLKESENRYRNAYEQLNNEMKERRRAEEALRESEERFREMAEMMPQTVFETDLTGQLVFVNRIAFDTFGYNRSDFERGLNSFEMIVPEDRDKAMENITKILAGERIGLSEYTAQRKDGSTFPIMIQSTPIVRGGKTLGLRGFIIDITNRKRDEEERRKLEAQFHQAQRLETIGTLAGGIAHDFNNLMTTILGNTSLMLYDKDPSHPHYELLKNIEKQIKRGAVLTKQLLGYARKGKYDAKPLDLNHTLAESAEAFGRTRKDLTIRHELADDLLTIEADHGQIQQVLLNLFVNAADAMPGGGRLMLNTKNVTHEDIKSDRYVPAPGNYVCLSVTDTGIGMDEQILDRIFDPFFTTKETGKGSGLGLASVWGIVKNHGGYIDVQSKKNQGTSFRIYLPASHKKIPESKEAIPDINQGSGTILIVDDEEMVLSVGVKLLKKLGYTVLEATSGDDALYLFKNNKDKIKLVILDIIMPDMGGGDVYDQLKQISPQIKVLLSSGYSIDGQAREIIKRGCNGFIQKPFSIKELSAKITEILTAK